MNKKKILMCTVLAEAFYKSRGELITEFLNRNYEVILAAPEPVDDIKSIFKDQKVKYYQIDLNRTGINPLSDFHLLKQLQTIIRLEQPEILYSFGGAKAAIYTTTAGFKEKVSRNYCMINGLGSIFHGIGFKNAVIKAIMSFLFKYALSKSHGVLFQNIDDLNEFVDHRIVDPKKCMIVNGSGVNLERFPYTKIESTNTFLFVGRLLRDKGIYEFVEAARTIKETFPNSEFWVVGGYDTNPTAVKESEMLAWTREGFVKYFERQDKILPFYQGCSVFVLPSYHEGTPRTSLEAMAVGRAIITTDAPGCRETVIEGKTGFMVPVKDSVQLAEKIKLFINNQELVSEMGNNAHDYAVKKYDVNKVNEAILSFILGCE